MRIRLILQLLIEEICACIIACPYLCDKVLQVIFIYAYSIILYRKQSCITAVRDVYEWLIYGPYIANLDCLLQLKELSAPAPLKSLPHIAGIHGIEQKLPDKDLPRSIKLLACNKRKHI